MIFEKRISTILFLQLFVLSSCSNLKNNNFSDIKLKETNFENTLRNPSSADQSCVQILSAFYKNQDEKRIASRIKATRNDPHKVLRSFPPVFYKFLKDLESHETLGRIMKTRGVMGGDIHIENFGVRTFKGEYRLLINDFDDLSEGPLFYDVLRLLTSIKLSGITVDEEFVGKFITRYKEGLKGKKENFSSVTKGFFKDAKRAERLGRSRVDFKKKIFLKKREPNFPMTDEETSAWRDLVADKGILRDQYKYVKESGGSGGLDRFELLIETENKELIWIEAKEWDIPGINAGQGTEAPSYEKRLQYVQLYDQPEFVSYTVDYEGKTFFIREVSEGHISLTIDGLNKKKREQMYLDEAYAKGAFHRAFGVPDEYIDELKNVNATEVIEVVDSTAKFVKKLPKKK